MPNSSTDAWLMGNHGAATQATGRGTISDSMNIVLGSSLDPP